jgi:hypothetical protein
MENTGSCVYNGTVFCRNGSIEDIITLKKKKNKHLKRIINDEP